MQRFDYNRSPWKSNQTQSIRQLTFPIRRPEDASTTAHTGIRNLGNTCYMNAVVQLLTAINDFDEQLCATESRCPPSITGPTVLGAICKIITQTKSTQRSCPIDPSVLREAIRKRSSLFGGYNQQDAHEFFRVVLDWVEEDCKPACADGKLDPVANHFRFSVRHTWRCDGCSVETSGVEPFYDISMDVPHKEEPWTFSKLLTHFFQREQVEKTCEKCMCTTASVRHEIVTPPKVLVLHMKRFVPNVALQTYDKCFHPVRIDEQLDIGPVCAQQPEAPKLQAYMLHGIVCHVGSTATVGHYVADTKAADGTWTHFNDSIASKCTTRELQSDQRQRNVYLAVYAL